ncbi:hypothetical protein [Mangrovimonas spongiae]|uniref:Bulb-type lectin domain-containing protein n=1 Tax=Mangrovimonas spongiae TaxID=2494697 RepID=A0A428K5Q3_9FLAO|nr:hypothetical protein [Mangrovimonas spongiae]RSK41747.1 hypothetical protein EJA19_02380 [Mangrovimonas spongiae]
MFKKTKHTTLIILLFCATFSMYNCSKGDDSNPLNIVTRDIVSINTFGGSLNDAATSITNTQDGGYAILGYTQSMDGDISDKNNESFDFWVLKFNSENTLLWSKTFGGTGNDRGNSIIETPDGSLAVLGFSDSNDQDVTNNHGLKDYWLAKLSPNGNLLWQQSFGYAGIDTGYSVIPTSDNGFLISGVLDVTASNGEGNSRTNARHAGGDYWALKLDASGNLEWSRYYGGFFTDTPYGVTETNDGGFIIVGSSDSDDVDISNNIGTYDFWIVKTSSTGDIVWEKNFGGTEIDEARAITQSNDGNYLIVGDTRSDNEDVSTNYGLADLWLIKITPEGDLLWQKSFGGSGFDVGRSISKTQNNNFVISGSSRSIDGNLTNNNGQNDAWVFEVNNKGNLLWQKTVGGSQIDFFYNAVQINNGNIITVGESNSLDFDIIENKGFTDLLITVLK